MGIDVSYANEIQDFGGVFRDSGLVADPFAVLKNCGANTVRVRLWYNPAWLLPVTGGTMYSDLADAERTISRAKGAGMAVNLDFHFSDTWADPGHQETPSAWQGLNLSILKDSLYNYTFRVLQYLESKNLTPEMVQVGNEINSGMLFPAGQVNNDNWTPFGELLKAGIRAVRDFSKNSSVKPKIILHVAQFQNADWWLKGITSKAGVTDFDIVGISHYAKWSNYNRMDLISTTIRNLRAGYGKPVMIVETAYPWTGENADNYGNIMGPADTVAGYPLTVTGQYEYMKDLTQAIINGGGTGIMYWEPDWITSPMPDKWGKGSSWENCALFDFQGNLLESADYMKFSYKF